MACLCWFVGRAFMAFGILCKRLAAAAAMAMAMMGFMASLSLQAGQVGLVKIYGAIGHATSTYLPRAIDQAAADHDACLIIQLDTPGGLLDSTKEIVEKLLTD